MNKFLSAVHRSVSASATKSVMTVGRHHYNRILSKFEKFDNPTINNVDIQTSILKSKLSNNYDTRHINGFYNYHKSSGNFIVSVDDNKYLDTFCNIATIPLGYNNPKLLDKFNEKEFLPLLLHRNALGLMPPSEWSSLIGDIVRNMAPSGLEFMHAGCGCGTGANENAIKATFLYKYYKENDIDMNKKDSVLHYGTAMANSPPGSPDYEILSFRNGFHGRSLGCLSLSHSKAVHKVGIPAFKWNKSDFPELKYDNSTNTIISNKNEEERILEQVHNHFSKNANIAGLIIEPIQSEGGDNHASNYFFKELRTMCKEFDIIFIADEVQTGMGSTGKFWAHEHWDLDTPPDIVTFAKKAQISGFFARSDLMPPHPYQIYGTWMGDAPRTMLLKEILSVMKEDNIIENVCETGNYLYENLVEFQNRGLIQNLRGKGKGTYIAFDIFMNKKVAEDERVLMVQQLKQDMRQDGVIVGTCGKQESIRLRPSLIFEKYHANIFLEKLENILK